MNIKAVENVETNISSDDRVSGLPDVELEVRQRGSLDKHVGYWCYQLRHEKKSLGDAGAFLGAEGPELLVEGALQAFEQLTESRII